MSNVIRAMDQLIKLFRPHCLDKSTIDELVTLIEENGKRRRGHDLFQRIRKKTLGAERANDGLLSAQYLFEEVCAKTLYNLSGEPAPFDADVPFRVVPSAIDFARKLDIPDLEVVRAIMS